MVPARSGNFLRDRIFLASAGEGHQQCHQAYLHQALQTTDQRQGRLNEWAYARPYRSETARTHALDTWLHLYNHHRHHTAIGGPPISRVNNLVGQNS